MSGFEIAIVSMAGRYSSAWSTDELWDALGAGRELNIQADPPVAAGHIPRYPIVPGADEFDHEFFGMSPGESALTDPQQRLLLTCGFQALENAGYADGTARTWGVFASASFSTYLLNNVLVARPDCVRDADMLTMIGNIPDSVATRLAYRLNLLGPAMTIQTACSSSLVALQVACRSLLDYECDGTLVAACSLTVPQRATRRHFKDSIFSADGFCRPFDAVGAGTVKGNGCSAVVLRRLEDALADHDPILAVIDGIAANNDGHDKIGYSAPSIAGEEEVIREALSVAGIHQREIDYIEAHGTGTALGDPIEVRALSRVFDGHTMNLPVGSIKANIGHLDCAAGLTSLVKVVGMLRTGVIPPLINFDSLNPEIDNSRGTFAFPVQPLERDLRHICISSFGVGGTNAHAVVSAYPGGTKSGGARRSPLPSLAPISGIRSDDIVVQTDALRVTVDRGTDPWDAAYSVLRNDRALPYSEVIGLGSDLPATVSLLEIADQVAQAPDGILPFLDACYEFAVVKADLLPDHQRAEVAVLLAVAAVAPQATEIAGLRLDGAVSEIVAALPEPESASWVGVLQKRERKALLSLLSFLAAAPGVKNLTPLFAGTGVRRVSVPNYPLARTCHWVGPGDGDARWGAGFPHSAVPATEPALSTDAPTALDRIVAEVSAVLRVDAGPDSDFFALGGDSLQAIDVLDRLSSDYPSLALSDLLAATSLREIALMAEKHEASAPPPVSVVPGNLRVLRDDAEIGMDPVFFIHPAGGTVFQYLAMSHLMNVPSRLVGISLPANYQDFQTLGELASCYAQQITSWQPDGPVQISGYSAGGNLALETARLLAAEGRQVAPPCLVDALPPMSYSSVHLGSSIPPGMLSYLLDTLGIDSKRFGQSVPRDSEEFRKVLTERGLTADESKNIVEKWLYCHQILSFEPPANFPGDLALICAADPMPQESLDELGIVEYPRSGWADYIDGDCHIVTVPGNHMSMMSGVNLRAVAHQVDIWLKSLAEIGWR